MNHPLLEKLETYYIRFKEIGQLITDPEVIQDMERYVRLTKEYKELETITRTADKFKAARLVSRNRKIFCCTKRIKNFAKWLKWRSKSWKINCRVWSRN